MNDGEGDDRLIAAVHQIVRNLGRTDTMADDILQVFSNYDGRLALDKLVPSPEAAADRSYPQPHQQPPVAHPASMSLAERSLRMLDRQISHFASLTNPIWSNSADAEKFLESVDDLLASLPDIDASGDQFLVSRADDLLQLAMVRLDQEFQTLIESPDDVAASSLADPGHPIPNFDCADAYGDEDETDDLIPIARPVTDFDIVVDAVSPGAISDANQIASRMVVAGFQRPLAEAYASARKDFIAESVARLGLRFRASEDVRSAQWDALEPEMIRWIPAFQMVFRILVPSERRLCDRVFNSLPDDVGDLAFAMAVRAPMNEILSFADAVAGAARAPERLFRVIDMYEAVRDVLPELDYAGSAIRADVSAVRNSLGLAIKGIFMELENLIRRDPANPGHAGSVGGVHPITRYVMNYLRAACSSRLTLEEVMFGDDASAEVDPDRPTSSLAMHVSWIMDVLLKNLDAKSRVCQEPGLSCIFLLNNGKYVLQKVNGSELGVLLGDEWVKQMGVKVRRWIGDYLRNSWGKIVSVLQTGDTRGPPASSRVMREKLRMFNGYLEDISREQAGWSIMDDQLRADVRKSVVDFVLPAHKNFLGRLKSCGDVGKDTFFKYSSDDVEARINTLFDMPRN